MKLELPYFQIENSYGGNQSWFRDLMMKLGGCAAVTACDICINMALYDSKSNLYPYDVNSLNKEDYIKFSKIMKPYLRPRLKGIDKLHLYINGFRKYLEDTDKFDIEVRGFSGTMEVEKAVQEIRKQIDNGTPRPYLLLKHKNSNFKYLTWHWFLIVGYEEIDNEFYVKIATYGKYHWLSFQELWATGYDKKGGMIILYGFQREEE